MDLAIIALVFGVVAAAFYAALRAFTRRRVAHDGKPVDTD